METVALDKTDVWICSGYLLSVLVVGVFFATYERWNAAERKRKRYASFKPRSKDHEPPQLHNNELLLEDYYLGGRRLPWWALGIADVSSYIDISGTMINTALIYALGIKGMYIEVRGGLCIFLAFQLAYTGKLSRRCPVKTRGEWIKFRFGHKRDGKLLRTIVAITSLVSSILMVTYFAVGGGKFVTEFIVIPHYIGLPSEFWAALFLMIIALCYTVMSGYTAIVYTDVYQSFFIFLSFIIVAILGGQVSIPEAFHVFMPSDKNEGEMIRILTTASEWKSLVPPNALGLPHTTSYSQYNSYIDIIVAYTLLQTARSASGPGGSGLQSILATKSELDVRLQTFLGMVLLALRWAFSAGIAALAINYTSINTSEIIDPERAVPFVIANILPTGIRGIVLASLLAAALTTFDTTVNSASSYWTVDIYQARIRPGANSMELLWQARISTLLIMLSGLFLSLYIDSINHIWGFVTIALAGAFIGPYVLSWYWSRFNAYGCLSGIIAGFIAAIIVFLYRGPNFTDIEGFAITFATSIIHSIIVCCLTKPCSGHLLRKFYRHVRPPGYWNEIKNMCYRMDQMNEIDMENRRDVLCTGIIATLQLMLYISAVSIVLGAYIQVLILGCIMLVLIPILYTLWYKNLSNTIDKKEDLLDELHVDLLNKDVKV